MAGRTVAGAALSFSCWVGDRLELAAGSLAGARRGPPVVASSRYGQELKAAPGVLARQVTGQAPGAVHVSLVVTCRMILRELEIPSFAGVDVVLSQRPKRLHLRDEICTWGQEGNADGALGAGLVRFLFAGRQAHCKRIWATLRILRLFNGQFCQDLERYNGRAGTAARRMVCFVASVDAQARANQRAGLSRSAR